MNETTGLGDMDVRDARDIRSNELRAEQEKAARAMRDALRFYAGAKIVAVLDAIEGKSWMGPIDVEFLFLDGAQAREVDRRIRALRESLASHTSTGTGDHEQ